jgi:hypothetical protein
MDDTILTAEIIQSSKILTNAGAVPGDKIINNKLIRGGQVTPPDPIAEAPIAPIAEAPIAEAPIAEAPIAEAPLKEKVLDLDFINRSKTLREANAAPGDKIINNKLVRIYSKPPDPNAISTEEIDRQKTESAWEQFNYSIDKAGNLLTNTSDILQSYFPMGGIAGDFSGFVSADEMYGEGYTAAKPEQRREMIMRKKERDLQNEYGQYFKEGDGVANLAGNVVKVLADPTNLIPLAKGYKAMAAGAAALGGVYSVTEDFAQNKEIDLTKAATTAVAAGVITPAMVKSVSIVASKVADRGANKIIDSAQKAINEGVSGGLKPAAMKEILEASGIDPLKVSAALTRTGRQLKAPANSVRAEKALAESIANDSAVTRTFSPSVDEFLGTLSTRVKNISVPVFSALRAFEFNTHVRTYKALKEVQPFIQNITKLSEPVKDRVSNYLFNGNFRAARALLAQRSPEMLGNLETAIKTIKQTGAELKESGHSIVDLDSNYFPRLVKDYEGLRAAMGKPEQGALDRTLKNYAAKLNKTVNSLTSAERSSAIDLHVRGYRLDTTGASPRFIKPRAIKVIPPELQKFYAPPEESLSMYLRGAVDNMEKRKFFGMDNVRVDSTGELDITESIGKLIDREMMENALTPAKQQELVELLQSRFIAGAKSPGDVYGAIRDLGYMGTIANPVSALTSLADVANSAAFKGLSNTVSSMFKTKEVKLIDLGIDSIMAEMGGDVRATSKALNAMMKAVQFQRIDKLGKETYINASLSKARQMVKSDSGLASFKKRNGEVYGKEFDGLVADLKEGNITDNVKLYLFNELSDIQPITLSEMPQKYLDHPNGRILYMLKSFTLKQWDIVRREIVQEYSKGNKQQAIKNAALMSGYLAAANVGVSTMQNIMMGRKVDPDAIPGNALWSLLGVFGMNKYLNDRYISRGEYKEALVNLITPATPLITAAFSLGETVLSDERGDIEAYGQIMKAVPVVGKQAYSFFGGGLEKWEDQEKARKAKADKFKSALDR